MEQKEQEEGGGGSAGEGLSAGFRLSPSGSGKSKARWSTSFTVSWRKWGGGCQPVVVTSP